MVKLKLYGDHHAKSRVTALTVAEDLQVFEESRGEFDPRVPALAVEEFDLDATPERLHHRVVVAVTDRSRGRQELRVVLPPGEGPRSELLPWSLWITVSARGSRLARAIPRALVTRVVSWLESIDQPTTLRLWASSTTPQYTLPSPVGCSVMSVTHRRSGSSRWNCRLTRSVAVAIWGTRRNLGLPENPAMPARRMSSSTAQWPTETPSLIVSSAWIRRTP